LLRQPDDADADGLKLGRVEDFSVPQVIDLTVGNEVEVLARDGTGCRRFVGKRSSNTKTTVLTTRFWSGESLKTMTRAGPMPFCTATRLPRYQ
jgi:hypothetical protein